MKIRFIITLLLLQLLSFGQTETDYEQKLNQLAEKRISWIDDERRHTEENVVDSLIKSNEDFENYLLKVTSGIPESLKCKFKGLDEKSIGIYTSADGNFRIYSWDTYEGGTMHFYRNILQYKANGKVYSKIYNEDTDINGVDFYEVNQVTCKNKSYYVTSSVMVGSSAVFYYEAKIFSIENDTIEDAKLIKTKSGLQNSVGYEIDFSSDAYDNNKFDIDPNQYMPIEYDKKNKTIVLALLTEDGIVTTKKIRYQFNGTYFEKIKKH